MSSVTRVTPQPNLAIVIVSFNVRAELEACLRSLAGGGAPPQTRICVVDNRSTDGSPDMVRATFPEVQVIDAGGNLGFARANNLGIRATRGDYVLLLNPDTLVPAGALETLIRTLDGTPDAAAAGPRLVDAAGAPELSFGWTISPLGELRQKIVGTLYHRGIGVIVRQVARWTRESGEREWISGACLLARRADLEEVGLLDERYFMYTEDVDLCLALGARGRKILFVADAEVVHLRGRSAAASAGTERHRRHSQLAFYRKHHPVWVPALKAYLRLTGKT